MAESIHGVLKMCNVQPDLLEGLLQAEKARIGMQPINLSPYAFLVQALAHSAQLDFQAKTMDERNKKTKIFIHGDMDLPGWMNELNERIIRV